MAVKTLNEIGLYKELISRQTSNASTYQGILRPIEEDAAYLLEYIRTLFPAYPSHNIQHSYRILEYIFEMLSSETLSTITDTEIFCLIMTALFHDTGMALYMSDDTYNVRHLHHEISTDVLDKYFEEKMKLIPTRDRLKTAISFACNAHGAEINDIYSCSIYQKKDKIEGDDVRYGILASLLRLGDLLDLDANRVNEFVISCFSSGFSKVSLAHNLRHLKVNEFYYSPNELKVVVTAETIEQYQIWSTWLQWLNNEVLYINTYLAKYGFNIPILNQEIKKPNDANFDVEELRFEIDDSGGIWKLLSQSIYTDELDFLRELIQNAIDATLFKYYLNSQITLAHQSPRSWAIDNDSEKIMVAFSENRKELIIVDHGVGMDDADLKRFLFKITGSGYAGADNRTFLFPSIAKFGIGFVSCLINATEIEIYTQKQTDKNTHFVSLSSSNNLAMLQKKKVENFQGTIIRLKLKSDFSFSKISDYLSNKFIFHSVDIIVVNLDAMELLCNNLNLHADAEKAFDKPYLLLESYEKTEEERVGRIRPLLKTDSDLTSILLQLDSLGKWIYDIQENEEKYPDIVKFKDFKKKLKFILTFTKEYNDTLGEFPLLPTKVDQKTLFNSYYFYIKKIESYSASVAKFIEENKKSLPSLRSVSTEIKGGSVSFGFPWKYCVIEMDDEFNVNKFTCCNAPIDLSNKTGILLLNHTNTDYDCGYEYSVINGFLFTNGEICNKLLRFTGRYINEITRKTYKKSYVLGVPSFEFSEDELAEMAREYDDENDCPTLDNYSIEDSYNSVAIINNHFISFPQTTKTELENAIRLRSYNEFSDNFDILSIVESSLIEKLLEQTLEVTPNLSDVDQINSQYPYLICQDGMRFNVDLPGFFPIGFIRMQCNLTANARIPLNVTRHKFSEIQSELTAWLSGAATSMQKALIDSIMNSLNEVSLSFNVSDIWNEIEKNTNDAINRELMKNFKMLSIRYKQ